jgi:hypothetical protein
MEKKSVVTESEQIQLAIQMIKLGARLQLLESQTSLSRERLIKLYKELKGVSPPKGMPADVSPKTLERDPPPADFTPTPGETTVAELPKRRPSEWVFQ